MAWTYLDYSNQDVNKVILDLQNALNAFDSEEASNAKLAISDQKNGHSRGVLFINPDHPQDPLPFPKGEWTEKTYYTEQKYDVDLYEKAKVWLNTLTISESHYSHVAFTNYTEGTATLTIFYANET